MEPYKNREEKAKWIVHQFDSIFKEIGSVLDIGCDEKHLEKILSKKIKYVGIDNFGKPDISFDLDKKEGLTILRVGYIKCGVILSTHQS